MIELLYCYYCYCYYFDYDFYCAFLKFKLLWVIVLFLICCILYLYILHTDAYSIIVIIITSLLVLFIMVKRRLFIWCTPKSRAQTCWLLMEHWISFGRMPFFVPPLRSPLHLSLSMFINSKKANIYCQYWQYIASWRSNKLMIFHYE